MLNIRNKYLLTFVLCFFIFSTSFIPQVSCENFQHQKIRDVLDLTNEMQVVINGVYYLKNVIPPRDKGKEIEFTKEQLQELFLEKAVIVSGEQINYWFGYETVHINGLIIDTNDNYRFSYNLAGFGYIFLDNKKIIGFGDMSKTVPEDRGE